MNCLSARKILLSTSDDDDVVSSGELFPARRHVAGCPDCRLFFTQEKEFSNEMQKKFPRQHASPGLRESVLSSVAKKRQENEIGRTRIFYQFRARGSVLSAIALTTILFVFAIFVLWRQNDVGPTQSVLNALIQDHLAMKLKEHPLDLETSDRDRLERWLAARVDFNVTVPRPANMKLKGGHLCLIGGKRSVSMSFEQDAVPLTLYMIDREGVDITRLKAVSTIGGNPAFLYDAKGCNTLLWEQRGLVYALVADLSEQELVNLMMQVS